MWWLGPFCTARRDEPLNVPGMRSRARLIPRISRNATVELDIYAARRATQCEELSSIGWAPERRHSVLDLVIMKRPAPDLQ